MSSKEAKPKGKRKAESDKPKEDKKDKPATGDKAKAGKKKDKRPTSARRLASELVKIMVSDTFMKFAVQQAMEADVTEAPKHFEISQDAIKAQVAARLLNFEQEIHKWHLDMAEKKS